MRMRHVSHTEDVIEFARFTRHCMMYCTRRLGDRTVGGCSTFATHCSTLSHTTTQCVTVCTEAHCHTHCSTMKHTATQWSTLVHATRCIHTALQHSATHRNTLQHTATHCNTMKHTATQWSTLVHAIRCSTLHHTPANCHTRITLHHTAARWNTMENIVTHCNALQHTATHCNTLALDSGTERCLGNVLGCLYKVSGWRMFKACCSVLQCVAVCCSVLQCVAVCCSVLQCVAVCCSVVQYVAACTSMY